MAKESQKVRSAVKRDQAESYLLISLVAFAVTVIGIRVFLEATGYPQIGNSVLHIAHAIWGGLLLFVAVIVPLLLANQWALRLSALFSGVGIGLFIDEVGKFITQANDYFYAPAAPIIYAFFLLTAVLYLFFRRPDRESPREAMYHVLEGLQEVLDGDLDTLEDKGLLSQLTIGLESEQRHISALAKAITTFLESEESLATPHQPTAWERTKVKARKLGQRLGRPLHRKIIIFLLILSLISSLTNTITLAWYALGGTTSAGNSAVSLLLPGDIANASNGLWAAVGLILQATLALLAMIALNFWRTGKEEAGVRLTLIRIVLALTTVQLLNFYVNQFSAISNALAQFGLLVLLLTYRQWYLDSDSISVIQVDEHLLGHDTS
jgi:hypothetical protein